MRPTVECIPAFCLARSYPRSPCMLETSARRISRQEEPTYPCELGRARTGVIKFAPFERTSRGQGELFVVSDFEPLAAPLADSDDFAGHLVLSYGRGNGVASSDQRKGYALSQGEVHGQRLKRGRGRTMMMTGGGSTM